MKSRSPVTSAARSDLRRTAFVVSLGLCLATAGLALAPTARPAPTGLQQGPQVLGSPQAAERDSVKTVVILLRHMKATRAMAIYQRVLGTTAETTLAAGKDNASVAVRDTRERIQRFRLLVSALDLPGEALRVYVRPVLHRSPAVLASLISEVLTARNDHRRVAIVPDAASRQLVISATKRMYMHIIDPLARRLDQKPAPTPRRR